MNIKKSLFLIPLTALLLIAGQPTHAESVYGKLGYRDDPLRVLIAYNDYDRSYYEHKTYNYKQKPRHPYQPTYRRSDHQIYKGYQPNRLQSYSRRGNYCRR